ncbi:ABC transporter substrate-binding protein [Nakamurella sp. PAMC28650]|uniref:ABC transporter substrate-binding protein n=1 Tax=Nakamurella sp. PAMC28650 TaxID=2762325 RepID=UPI00164E9EA1|nr:ABC transporter substrate-binding protein [Nakamurella sp. PAMC28650]QNK81968.1 carbohydrate ABC transporter substrate-binding protein [Nakamurella sp. PAMC28650]
MPIAVLTAGVTLAACSGSSGTGASPGSSSASTGAGAMSSAPMSTSVGASAGASASAGAGGDGSAGAVVPMAASGQAPDATVTVCQFAGPEYDAIQHFGTQFTAMTGGKIKIKMVSIPINQNLPVTINQIRTSSTCDLVDAGAQQAADLNPYLVPLSTFMNDSTLFNATAYHLDDFPKAVQTVSSDAKRGLMSLTYGSDVQMLYYRKDLMAQWGITVPSPPAAWTWEQFEAALQTVQTKIKARHHGDVGIRRITFQRQRSELHR